MEAHYADLAKKGFFAGLVEYMSSGPVCAMVGKATTLSRPAERCSVPPSPPTLSPAPSVVTSASMSVETSATAPTLLSPLRPRSSSGSRTRRSANGPTTATPGFTSDFTNSAKSIHP